MRIDRLDLIAYGEFVEKSLDLSGGTMGLHIIYGDNEAGKSTSLRALSGLLFGIPARTTDNYLHRNQQLRVGAKLRLRNGSTLEFIRRKGNKNTVLDACSGSVMEEGILAQFLPAGIDGVLFEKLYGINHSRLVTGGQELLNQSGEIGQALFSAAAGTENLKEILENLNLEADALFKPQASSKVVNRTITEFKSVTKEINDLMLPVEHWKKLRGELSELLSTLREIDDTIATKSEERSRLERIKRVSGAVAERKVLLEKLEKLGSIKILPEDFEQRRRSIAERIIAGTDRKKKAAKRLIALAEAAEPL